MWCALPLVNAEAVALVDADIFDWASRLRWRRSSHGYAQTTEKSGRYLHRLVMAPPRDVYVDHANGDGLDNRRQNLRLCRQSQNQGNRGQQKNNVSGFKGVYRDFSRPFLWRAQITVDQKKLHIGCFADPVTAASAYDKAAVLHFGEFARVNFSAER